MVEKEEKMENRKCEWWWMMRKMPTEEEVIYQPVVLLDQISVPVAVAEEEVEQIVFVPDLPVLRPGLVPGTRTGYSRHEM